MSWEDILKQEKIPNWANMVREIESMEEILSDFKHRGVTPQTVKRQLPSLKNSLKRLELLAGSD